MKRILLLCLVWTTFAVAQMPPDMELPGGENPPPASPPPPAAKPPKNTVLPVPKEATDTDATTAPLTTPDIVKLRVPTNNGQTMDVAVNRDQLLNQLSDRSNVKTTFRFDRTPIIQVFTDLANLMNKSFEAPTGIPSTTAGAPSETNKYLVTGVYHDMTPREVFYRIAKIHGLRVREEMGVLRVFSESEVNVNELVAVVYHTKYVNLYNYYDSIRGFLSPKGRIAVNAMSQSGKLAIDDKGDAKSSIDVKGLFGPINSGAPQPVSLGSGSSGGSTGGGNQAGASVKSDKDTTDAVLPNNAFSITIFDLPEVHEAIRDFLDSIDKPRRQIAIQVRYYRFSNSPVLRYGVGWDSLINRYQVSSLLGDKSGTPSSGTSGTTSFNTFEQFARMNSLKVFAPNTLLFNPNAFNILLSFFQGDSSAKAIAAPNAIAQHGQTTFLRAVTRVPYLGSSSSNSSGGTSTQTTNLQFLDIGTTLNVTPFILDDDAVDPAQWELYLDLRPEITRQTGTSSLPSVGNVPIVIAVAPTTSVRMRNGDTVLIGGLTDQSFTKTSTGIPYLKDIPLLGWLFGEKSNGDPANPNSNEKSELVILVTAKIFDHHEKVMPNVTEAELAAQLKKDQQRDQIQLIPVGTPLEPFVKSLNEKQDSTKYRANSASHSSMTRGDYRPTLPQPTMTPASMQPYYDYSMRPEQGRKLTIARQIPLTKPLSEPSLPSMASPNAPTPALFTTPATSPNYIRSPYAPDAGLVDVTGFKSGDQARCPFTGKIFIIP